MATTTLTQTAVVQRLWHAVEVMRQVEEAKRRETGATALLNFLFGSALEGVSPDAPLRCSCHFSAAQESRPPTNHHYSTQQGATLREVLGTRLEVHPCPFSQRLGVPLKHNRFVVNITQKGYFSVLLPAVAEGFGKGACIFPTSVWNRTGGYAGAP
ncbi:hypothetical protein HRbin17_00502 [bacterium HR17]|uniref:Uncharacterized protein n=1 Tax=Candidatus Fervidibacter japonicus TaxID=2035412 RepID=A0A2H5XA71_9BACT|nr:hypothetical protein HRbin17_00502 [bacterium HR17]